VRFPAGNLLIPGFLFIALESAPETPPPVPSLTHAEAWERVCQLPEVRRYAERVEQVSRGEVHATIYPDSEPVGNLWDFYVGESHPDHNVRWARLMVDAFTGRLYAWDWSQDQYVAYEQWRLQEGR